MIHEIRKPRTGGDPRLGFPSPSAQPRPDARHLAILSAAFLFAVSCGFAAGLFAGRFTAPAHTVEKIVEVAVPAAPPVAESGLGSFLSLQALCEVAQVPLLQCSETEAGAVRQTYTAPLPGAKGLVTIATQGDRVLRFQALWSFDATVSTPADIESFNRVSRAACLALSGDSIVSDESNALVAWFNSSAITVVNEAGLGSSNGRTEVVSRKTTIRGRRVAVALIPEMKMLDFEILREEDAVQRDANKPAK